jgi:hypothetical protein
MKSASVNDRFVRSFQLTRGPVICPHTGRVLLWTIFSQKNSFPPEVF